MKGEKWGKAYRQNNKFSGTNEENCLCHSEVVGLWGLALIITSKLVADAVSSYLLLSSNYKSVSLSLNREDKEPGDKLLCRL